jgi:hypothetical protein
MNAIIYIYGYLILYQDYHVILLRFALLLCACAVGLLLFTKSHQMNIIPMMTTPMDTTKT